jgi:two-component system, cell cycle sensor histidine kinase and response regulator CckA
MRKMERFLSGFLGKNIDLRLLAGGGLLPVMADSGRLERVVMNLAVNARDAMPAGGALVITTGRMDMDAEFIKSHGYGQFGEYAFISVTDTGVGMDEGVRKRIFEPFFTTKASGKGTGFGLSVVYDILKEHSGYVDVASERGKGTTFTVYLPLLDRVLPAAGPEPSPARAEGHETILLAEDDEAARSYCAAGLGEAGYAVIEACDGEDAVRRFRDNKERIKLLVLDIIMPSKNGKEVFEAARKIQPGVKALFISGYAEDLLQKTGMINGNHSFLMKPASRSELLKKVREVLDS